jgi:hypothetical protein
MLPGSVKIGTIVHRHLTSTTATATFLNVTDDISTIVAVRRTGTRPVLHGTTTVIVDIEAVDGTVLTHLKTAARADDGISRKAAVDPDERKVT